MTRIIGYSTVDAEYTSRQLSGIDLAKRDLLNHFGIRKGEKWTNPEFGSNLPYYVFQPLDDATVDLITQDVFDVVGNDPRFEMNSNEVTVSSDEQSVTVVVYLTYLPTTTATDLQIKFDREFEQSTEF
jgi:phage baseplate assembly protein W